MCWNKWAGRLLCLSLLALCARGGAEGYVATNRDTRAERETAIPPAFSAAAYTPLYESDVCAFYFRDDRDVIAVVDKRTGYVWKTGLDAGFPADIKAAVKAADSAEALRLAAEPIEKSLNARYIGIANSILLEGDDGPLARQALEQLIRAQQELRVAGLAETLIADHEGFIDQHATGAQQREQQRKTRAKQVIAHHHGVELAPLQRPGCAFQVGLTGVDLGQPVQ